MQLRVGMAFLIALVTFPVVWQHTPDGVFSRVFLQPASLVFAVATELSIGWALGWTASLLIWAAQLAGHLIGQDIGLSMGEIFDPMSQSTSSPMSQLFFTLALLAFVLLDGHQQVVLAVARSFQVVPPGSMPWSQDAGVFLTETLGGKIWLAGLQIALPTMVALLLVTVAMAVLARAVPEMNIFILGFAVRIGFGLFTLLVMLPLIPDAFGALITYTVAALEQLLRLWGGG
jgi:flagellar biosynthetic protein FliR